jgi:hypothetical protein
MCIETIIEALNSLQELPTTDDLIDLENSMGNSCSIVAKDERKGR